MLYVPGLPFWSGLAIAFAARNSAVYFTKWYPEYQRIKHEGAVGSSPGLESRQSNNPSTGSKMKDVFARLATDFLSAIVFLVVYLATDNVVLATAIAIAGAIGQVIYARIKGQSARLHDLGQPRRW